jgi:hypothetical protein
MNGIQNIGLTITEGRDSKSSQAGKLKEMVDNKIYPKK